MSAPRDNILSNSVLSSSPEANREPTSPTHRHPSDASDHIHHSPVLSRSFDPEARERQRTMDVDMALHLSRARRDTVSYSPEIAPMVDRGHQEEDVEEHHVNDSVINHETDDEVAMPPRDPSRIDFNMHLSQTHDPTLLVQQSRAVVQNQNPDSLFGLPTYQPNIPRVDYDFEPMEEFAATEKAKLGLSTSSTKFSLDALRHTRSALLPTQPQDVPVAQSPPTNSSDDSPRPGGSITRHRKLSQSQPHPRIHRRGIGGKMALFENPQLSSSGAGATPSLTSRLGLGRQHDQHMYETLISGSSPPNGGILNTGHDRPYRFSFYSNALAATIHSRSLSELPAEGQTFEDLFAGNHAKEGADRNGIIRDPNTTAIRSPLFAANRPQAGDGYFPPNVNGNGAGNKNGNRKPDNPGDNGNGSAGDSESEDNTWWLDVTSPTDEEMKMLSLVGLKLHSLLYAPTYTLICRFSLSIP